MDVKVETERLKVEADALAGKVKELIHEGNVRRIIIKNDQGQTVMEVPVTFGVVGAIAAPVVAAIGAIAALAARWTIEVERKQTPAGDAPKQLEGAGPGA
jgi:hypothetical protein